MNNKCLKMRMEGKRQILKTEIVIASKVRCCTFGIPESWEDEKAVLPLVQDQLEPLSELQARLRHWQTKRHQSQSSTWARDSIPPRGIHSSSFCLFLRSTLRAAGIPRSINPVVLYYNNWYFETQWERVITDTFLKLNHL